MTTIATATISGHEARGQAELIRQADGSVVLQLQNLAVAPGAPDVRLYLSANTDGSLGTAPIELGKIADTDTRLQRDLPADLDIDTIGSVVVHCTVYSVLFGFGVFQATGTDT